MNNDAMDMTSMEMAVPGWLTPVSWIFVALGVISAALVLYDIVGRGHRQPNAAMNVVWPISALYLGPFGVWAYNRWGKTSTHQAGRSAQPTDDVHGQALTGSTPGGAAATVGHFIGVPLVVASGLTIAGTNLWVLIIVIALLAIALLFVFEYFFVSSVDRRSSTGTGMSAALLTATVTVLAFDIGMGGWMLAMHFGNFMPEPTDIRFFFLMQIGLVLGFLTAYPAVRGLIQRRVKVTA